MNLRSALTRVVGVVCGLLLDHHVGRWEPVRVGVRVRVWVRRVGVGVGLGVGGSVSCSAPVPAAGHLTGPLVKRVQVFLLKALLQVRHAGVRVLAVVSSASASATSTSSATATAATDAPASGCSAAMSRRRRWHALKGLAWWWELGAQRFSWRALIPGTEEIEV